jgi:membrane fusion protein, copper/silver efflux system
MKRISVSVLLLALLLGSFWAGSWYTQRTTGKNGGVGARKILYYVDPMHPAYKSDKPGIAPDCGMELVPVYEDESMGGPERAASSMPPGTVNVGPEKQQLIGVKVSSAEKRAGAHTQRILGRVAADETRTYVINATVDGWITKALPNSTGTLVRKNEVLATFYSPEFLSAVQALLFALNSMDRVQTTGKENPAQRDQIAQFNINLQQYKDSLKNLGMGDLQIENMIRTREWVQNVDITSPADGFILVRNVSQGLRFDKGREMYRIADLSRIWILADVFEDEAEDLKVGSSVTVSLPRKNKKRTFQAKVSNILPQFDGATRTLKVRLETDNPGYVLRPEMFVDVEFPIALPPTIAVPVDAVVDSGTKKTVYVDKGDGVFEPRKVETGWRAGGQIEIAKGLMPGERIVVSGTFLLDSESRMKAAAAGIYGETSEDPVCGMEVDQGKTKAAGLTAEYKGQTFYFCSDDCKTKFAKEPTKYSWKVGKDATTEAGKRLGNVQWEGGKAKEKESAHVGHMPPRAPSAGK